MPIADSDVKWVSTPKIGLFEQLYVPAIFQGLQTTVRHARKTLFGGGAITARVGFLGLDGVRSFC